MNPAVNATGDTRPTAAISTGTPAGPSVGPAAPLAVLGGPKAVTHDGPHFRWPPITEATTAAVLGQLQTSISVYDRSGVIADLETALARYHGAAYAVLTSSGTAALHAMYAAALRPGDEVIVPAYTFFATVTPLLHLGVRPVLADCDENGKPREWRELLGLTSGLHRSGPAMPGRYLAGLPEQRTTLRP